MRQYILLFILIGFCIHTANAQTLYMPRDVQQAFKKETRSPDGKPGKNYWQNRARYTIDITAMPPDRTVRGKETITYFNNSPDSLRTMNIKLFLNIHKPGAPRNGGASPDYLTSGVHIDKFAINGQERPFRSDPGVFTNVAVRLPKALPPRDSIQLAFDWHYEVSVESGREGMIDSTTFFLAYFYPRVAVYDDYNGWDRINFMDSHEFYSDFNDYVVTVNVPKNYIVWGTGTLQEPEKLLQPAILQRFRASLTSEETIRIVTSQDLAAKNVTAQNAMNSWQFRSRDIPDVAFGLSDHFVWDGTSVIVDGTTRRRASAQAAYNDTVTDYPHVARYAKNALSYLSNKWPGIPYPYEKTTVFHGYAGMEYPMMANDESYKDTIFSRFVAEHEIAHTYMPFYMGINETRYGFMDEGWATTFEIFMNRENLGVERAEEFYRAFRVNNWINDPSSTQDIPIIMPGDALTGPGFGNNEYGKASLGYLAVKDLLGDEMFRKCLHAFMDRWHGKHPIPWDFFNTFNDVSGKNLNWFWNSWFFNTGYIDLSLDALKKTGTGYSIGIKNIGGYPAPADLVIRYTDSTTETKHLTPAVWQKDQRQASVALATKKKIASVELKGGIFMDADKKNNNWPAAEKKGF